MIPPSVKILYDEHEVIVSAIELAKKTGDFRLEDPGKYEKILRELIYFFRNYEDRFHHFKEERVLFPEMNRKNEFLENGVIKEMLDNHESFRDSLLNIEKNLDSKNFEKAGYLLKDYSENLLNHIAVENEEVFLMVDTLFQRDEIEKINFRFTDFDHETGLVEKRKLEAMISEIMEKDFS